MRDILDELSRWFDDGEAFALATVVRTWKSSPREPGAAMAVSQSGEVVGSVSGGCIEGALYDIAGEALADGHARTEVFRVTDDDAFGVGLTCGGTIEVFVQRVDAATYPEFAEVARRIGVGEPVAVVTDREPVAHRVITLDGDGPETEVRLRLAQGESEVYVDEERSQIVEIFAPRPRMYIFGAIDFASALCTLGKFAGYRVTVIDARPVFATPARFPDADEIVVTWPHVFLESAPIDPTTVVAVLTHDEKFDIPLLERALRCDAGYIGAMGSRSTHERRVALLREAGLSADELARLHSPIGLDLGARTPEETAVSILAEILVSTRGATGRSLAALRGPIHRVPTGRAARPAACPPAIDGVAAAL
ncbi:XdhC family protein [Rhodococcus sp. B50]|uniref:XdhC family protein n=1 Tax=Rhodococcus sp. B50 TaxID=2682847 RepID=UPI001BD4C030|nr:XdhC family protein [Rhodococcus sp. B50]MBS9374975.1 putative xanthine dehydrogenase subunit A [Rhodococcus sp. B50]